MTPWMTMKYRLRQLDIISDYLQGKTLNQISIKHGISRERVRQVMSQLGISRKDGGVKKRIQLRKKEKLQKRRDYIFDTYGCTLEIYEEITHKNLLTKYTKQRLNAKERNIGWDLNLYDWYSIWMESGKINMRGIKHGQYVMARFNDDGSYSKDNVEIVLNTENIIERYTRVYGGDYSGTVKKAQKVALKNNTLEVSNRGAII